MREEQRARDKKDQREQGMRRRKEGGGRRKEGRGAQNFLDSLVLLVPALSL
jgi:hypothetical protein